MIKEKIELSGIILLLANLLTIALAVLFEWKLAVVLWGYWLESVIIGLFTVARLLNLGIRMKSAFIFLFMLFLSVFFCFHYGMFHFVYMTFLLMFDVFRISLSDLGTVLLLGGIFFISHLFSFVKNSLKEKLKFMDVPELVGYMNFMEPYSRILPMHLTILASAFLLSGIITRPGNIETIVLVIFMLLKTIVDFRSHQAKHTFSPSFTQQMKSLFQIN